MDKRFITLFFTAFIDMLGIGIVIPVLGHLFLDINGILPGEYLLFFRTLYLGLLIASYPLAQFFGAPLLGALSDRHGRKKILLISLIGTCIGYIMFAYAIITRNLLILFLSRILDGFTGGNISTIMSSIADISEHKDKAKNFGIIGMAFGIGVIFGPMIGGILSDPSVNPLFSSSTPFFFAAFLAFVNILLVIFAFKETLPVKIHSEINLFTGFKNIKKAMGMENLRTMFLVMFLLTFGFNFYTQFFQVYLIEKFNFSQARIGYIFAYLGIWIAFTQGFLTRIIAKKWQPEQVLKVTLLTLSFFIMLQALPNNPVYFYFVIPFIAFSNGITYPNATAVISNLAAKDSQGEILGINQSIQSLGMAIPPVLAGIIASVNVSLPIFISSFFIFISWIVFINFRKKKEIFHEV